jgi:hypothetical protein
LHDKAYDGEAGAPSESPRINPSDSARPREAVIVERVTTRSAIGHIPHRRPVATAGGSGESASVRPVFTHCALPGDHTAPSW